MSLHERIVSARSMGTTSPWTLCFMTLHYKSLHTLLLSSSWCDGISHRSHTHLQTGFQKRVSPQKSNSKGAGQIRIRIYIYKPAKTGPCGKMSYSCITRVLSLACSRFLACFAGSFYPWLQVCIARSTARGSKMVVTNTQMCYST